MSASDNCYEYLNLKPDELQKAIDRIPVAYLALGALEWHAPHLPLGLDSLKAEYMVRKAWEKTGGVFFPTDHWHSMKTMAFPYTFKYPESHFKKYLKQTLKVFNEMGFKVIVILTGHYPMKQVTMLRKLSRKNNKKGNSILIGCHEPTLALDKDCLGDHAAKWETSFMMAVDNSTVDMSKLDYNELPSPSRVADYGIIGEDPKTTASLELGREVIDFAIDNLVDLVNRNLKSPDPESIEKLFKQHEAYYKHPLKLAMQTLDCKNNKELIQIGWWHFKKTGRIV